MSDTAPERLEIDGIHLRYLRGPEQLWKLAIDELLLVAEYSTDQGPLLEDYFFVFAVGRPPAFFEAPVGANPRIMTALSDRLGHSLSSGLANSTQWKSRVIWPPQLEGRELFIRTAQPRSAGVLNELKDKLLPRFRAELASDVADYFHGSEP
jgi:hypothetical protein